MANTQFKYEDTSGNKFATQQEAAASNTALGTNPIAKQTAITPTPVSTVPNTALKPTSPLIIPTVNNTSAQTALTSTAIAAAQPENVAPPVQPTTPEQPSTLKTLSDTILSKIGIQSTQGAKTAEYQNEQDVAGKTTALNDINNKITTTSAAYEKQIKDAQKNTLGKTRAGLEGEVRNLERQRNEDIANLNITKSVALGDLNTANDIVKQKIAAEFEPLQNEIASLQQVYNLMQNDMTESEKFQAQNTINQKETEANNLISAKQEAYQTALSNGAPTSVLTAIGAAATPDAAYQAVGQYGMSAEVQKLKSATSTGGSLSPVTQSIIDNPSLFDDLTPTVKGQVIAQLQASGYDTSNLGVKGLSDTAITQVAQTQKALSDLDTLKLKIQGNEQFIGPLSGFARFNPWSKARQIQADVDRVKQTVGKALEGGVLRKEDEDKYKKILATLSDTPSTAIYKIDALISSIQRDMETYKTLQQASGRSLDTKAPLSTGITVDFRSKYGY